MFQITLYENSIIIFHLIIIPSVHIMKKPHPGPGGLGWKSITDSKDKKNLCVFFFSKGCCNLAITTKMMRVILDATLVMHPWSFVDISLMPLGVVITIHDHYLTFPL